MALLKENRQKQEKINGVVYDMPPSPDYTHGIVNNNINTIIKSGLKDSLCLVFMENLDFHSYFLQDDPEEEHYNAKTEIRLKTFPHIKMELGDIFEGII
ncbi:MAG: hypothetical protein K2N46_11530 [Lachnospiraceae bacterium]|nr:hypothetical protein [Lachnospiraceae bacterium]